ncbi:hypothetical protein GCM10011319_22060 [Mameliella alba]|nr:hypothetical protein GCM10011319_22060 [Mameliella alba]
MTQSPRKRRPSDKLSDTKSSDQRWFGPCGIAMGALVPSPTTFDKLESDQFMPAAKRIYSRNVWDVRKIGSAIEDLPGGAEDARLESSEDW